MRRITAALLAAVAAAVTMTAVAAGTPSAGEGANGPIMCCRA
ncbi:MAG: hypothetical protein ACJ74O_19230 [Frankiaceae bacterium]